MFTNLQTDSAIYMHTWRHLSGETRTFSVRTPAVILCVSHLTSKAVLDTLLDSYPPFLSRQPEIKELFFFFQWSEISMKNMIMQLHAGNITCQWCVQVLVGAYSTEDEQYEEVLFFLFGF